MELALAGGWALPKVSTKLDLGLGPARSPLTIGLLSWVKTSHA
jgi:hypothetical protein